MQQLKQLIETAGPTNSRVLIGGENGTGEGIGGQGHPSA